MNNAGTCRVMLPTVPRSGSTWFRQVFESVTGLRTCSIYNEGKSTNKTGGADMYLSSRKCWVSVNDCGASATTMQGGVKRADIPTGCRNTRIPAGDDPTLVKSHLPFQSVWGNEVRWLWFVPFRNLNLHHHSHPRLCIVAAILWLWISGWAIG